MSLIRSILALAVVAVPLLAANPASADLCKAPKVVVKNDKTTTIKVTKIMYYDGCDKQWRTEDVSAREISPGASTTYSDDLEYVGNCSVSKFKLYRSVRNSTGSAYDSPSWGGELAPDGGAKTCNTGTTYTIHAH
jgi:hypothetical protein